MGLGRVSLSTAATRVGGIGGVGRKCRAGTHTCWWGPHHAFKRNRSQQRLCDWAAGFSECRHKGPLSFDDWQVGEH